MNVKAAKALSQEVDRILWEVWDTIGVNAHAAARDEYSHYVSSVVHLLISGADVFKISQHLYSLEHASMSCVTDKNHRDRVALLLLDAYHERA